MTFPTISPLWRPLESTETKIDAVAPSETDKYGRTVAVVLINGINVNKAMVKDGWAWVYRKYFKNGFCSDWLGLERQARNQKIGLWADPHVIPPWEWRKNCNKDSYKQAVAVATAYNGNRKSHVFHRSSCRHFNCKNCTEGFGSRSEALQAGYKPCGRCRP